MAYFLICGSRGFTDYELITFNLALKIEEYGEGIFIQGGCKDTADEICEAWCKFHEWPCLHWPARWNYGTRGKGEGPARNKLMGAFLKRLVQTSHFHGEVLAFWDGRSRGTLGMMNIAKEFDIRTTYVRPNGSVEIWHEPSVSRRNRTLPFFGD